MLLYYDTEQMKYLKHEFISQSVYLFIYFIRFLLLWIWKWRLKRKVKHLFIVPFIWFIYLLFDFHFMNLEKMVERAT